MTEIYYLLSVSQGRFSAPTCHSQVLIMSPTPEAISQHDYLLHWRQNNLSHTLNFYDFGKGQTSLLRTHLIRPGPPGILSLLIHSKWTEPWEFTLLTMGVISCYIHRFHPGTEIIKMCTPMGGYLGSHVRILSTTSWKVNFLLYFYMEGFTWGHILVISFVIFTSI